MAPNIAPGKGIANYKRKKALEGSPSMYVELNPLGDQILAFMYFSIKCF